MERKVRSSVAMTVAVSEKRQKRGGSVRTLVTELCGAPCQPTNLELICASLQCVGAKNIPSDPNTKYMYVFTSVLDLH